MSTALNIARRELGAYFVSPIAYIVTAAFLFISGLFFAIILINTYQASLEMVFANVVITLLFIAPLLTMRLLADEYRSGTIEVLLTAPVSDWQVVLGKFLAALGLFCIMLLITLYYPLMLWRLGGNPDIGPIVSGYIGMLLLGSAMLALGTLTSAMTQNQIVAAVASFGIVLVLWLLEAAASISPDAAEVLSALSLREHYDEFARGAINASDVLYYLSLTAGSLFVATRILETRRYRS